MSELEDIQAIFFEEAEEGLATAEAGLSAMAEGCLLYTSPSPRD